jgi:hypothetical protein
MGQVSSKLRRGEGRYFHWCPGCEEMHPLPDTWRFDGDLESPTFHPNFRHSWGDNAICHYNLLGGVLWFCADCTHDLAGLKVPLPDLPPHLRDET